MVRIWKGRIWVRRKSGNQVCVKKSSLGTRRNVGALKIQWQWMDSTLKDDQREGGGLDLVMRSLLGSTQHPTQQSLLSLRTQE
jgi:hypothetical protein